MYLKIIIFVLIGLGIFFSLPSTMYIFMFLGIFYKHKCLILEKDDLRGTQYYPITEKLKKDILHAKSIPCEEVTIKSNDGLNLFGRYYNVNSDKTIIFSHGYQSNAFNNFSTIMIDYLDKGYNVLLIDQRAHAKSEGKFTTLGCKEQDDLLLWVDYIDNKKDVNDIFIYGISMGATTVGYASEKMKSKKVKGLIMESGFTCFYDELKATIGNVFMKKAALKCVYLISKKILHIDIKKSVEESLKNNNVPVLFIHGDCDREVSLEFTKRNFSACSAMKELIIVEGADHTLCYIIGTKKLHTKIDDFLKKCIDEKYRR